MNKQRKEKQPLYVRNPLLSISVGVVGVICSVFPLMFAFGFLDFLVNINNWQSIYLVIALMSFSIFGIAVIAVLWSTLSEYSNLRRKYKTVGSCLKHFKWKDLLFGVFIISGLGLFYVAMIGWPIWKDFRGDLESYTGDCKVWRRLSSRGPNPVYVTFVQDNGEELELRISGEDYHRLKGIEDSGLLYNCNYDVEAFYTPHFKKVVYLRSASKTF